MIEHDELADVDDPAYPTHYTVEVYSKEGRSTRTTDARNINDELRKIGLEWKQADWPHRQTVLIVVSPIEPTQVKPKREPFPAEAICPIHGFVSLLQLSPSQACCGYGTEGHMPGSNGVLMVRNPDGIVNYINGARPVGENPPSAILTIEDLMVKAREQARPYAKRAARALSDMLLK